MSAKTPKINLFESLKRALQFKLSSAASSEALVFDPYLVPYLSSDTPTLIAFSSGRNPSHALFAYLAERKNGRVYVQYAVCARLDSSEVFNHDSPIYSTSCFEDVSDVWMCFA